MPRRWSQSGFKPFPAEGVSVPAGLEGSEGVTYVKGHDGFFFSIFMCVRVGLCGYMYVYMHV